MGGCRGAGAEGRNRQKWGLLSRVDRWGVPPGTSRDGCMEMCITPTVCVWISAAGAGTWEVLTWKELVGEGLCRARECRGTAGCRGLSVSLWGDRGAALPGHREQGSVSSVWAAWVGQAVGRCGQQHSTGWPGRVWAAEARCRQDKQWGSAGRAWTSPGCTEPHHCA